MSEFDSRVSDGQEKENGVILDENGVEVNPLAEAEQAKEGFYAGLEQLQVETHESAKETVDHPEQRLANSIHDQIEDTFGQPITLEEYAVYPSQLLTFYIYINGQPHTVELIVTKEIEKDLFELVPYHIDTRTMSFLKDFDISAAHDKIFLNLMGNKSFLKAGKHFFDFEIAGARDIPEDDRHLYDDTVVSDFRDKRTKLPFIAADSVVEKTEETKHQTFQPVSLEEREAILRNKENIEVSPIMPPHPIGLEKIPSSNEDQPLERSGEINLGSRGPREFPTTSYRKKEFSEEQKEELFLRVRDEFITATDGRYAVIRRTSKKGRLGKGGLGMVFWAKDTQDEKKYVAIKVFPRALCRGEENYEMFKKEAEIMKKMDHPNIAKVLDEKETDSGFAMVMERYDRSMADWRPDKKLVGPQKPPVEVLEKVSEFDEQQFLDWIKRLEGLASAVGAVHGKKIVHRDIKA